MLKRIAVRDVRPGMFLHDLCGSWLDHPFWRTRFLLEDPADLQLLRASAVREVWIDPRRGLDVVEPEAPTVSRQDVEKGIDVALTDAGCGPVLPGPMSMQAELAHATRLYYAARPALESMFAEARMGRAVDQARASAMVEEIGASVARNSGALISVVRLKHADDYTFMHSLAVSALMIALARQLQLDEATTHFAGLGGLLHDIGKAEVPMEVLNKPGKLAPEEYAQMQAHPVLGYRLLLRAGTAEAPVLDVCLHHHEKMGGGGYPDGVAGESITLLSRMAAVCDVYDAVTSNRPYKPGWEPAESIRRMAEWAPANYDDRVFKAFVRSIGIYPVGALVRLESGRLAVVTEQNPNLTQPVLRAFYSTRLRRRISPERVDLALGGDRVVSREEPRKWGLGDCSELWASEDVAQAFASGGCSGQALASIASR